MLVPLLGVAWLINSHNVTLQVDGQAQVLTSYASTVGDLLERADIKYSEHDEVVPAPDTPVQDGMVVEVVHAREITVLIGDKEETVLVTALSVDEVIDQLAGRSDVSRRSTVRVSRLMPVHAGMRLRVLNPVAVTVVADGKEREVVTDAPNVEGVLRRLGINLAGDDRVTPALNTLVEADLRITVERVRTTRERQTVEIPYETIRRYSDRLTQGQEREVQAGENGSAHVVELVTVVDGDEVSRYELRRTDVIEPQSRIIEVGTAAPPSTGSSSPDSNTESSSPEPRETTPSQPASEPSSGNSQSGQASYYYHPEEGMTAAHRTLPFGTVVTVTNRANGKSIRVTINDRGPYIDGRIIDLNEPAFTQIASKSTGVIDVRITW